MRAVLYERFGERPRLAEVPEPSPPPGGVVVEVRATGICRSDWHGWMGHDPDIELPHVPGHEFAGVVSAVGEGVRRFRAIMLTSFTTAAGLTPILLEKSLQAQFVIPTAVSLSFGIIFATVITLFLIPALYILQEDFVARVRDLKNLLLGRPAATRDSEKLLA